MGDQGRFSDRAATADGRQSFVLGRGDKADVSAYGGELRDLLDCDLLLKLLNEVALVGHLQLILAGDFLFFLGLDQVFDLVDKDSDFLHVQARILFIATGLQLFHKALEEVVFVIHMAVDIEAKRLDTQLAFLP